MTDREVMQQALDAIHLWHWAGETHLLMAAHDALRTALEQQAEPVAWMFQHDETGRMNYVSNDGIHNPTTFIEMNPRYALVCPLYTAPPAAQPEQVDCPRCGHVCSQRLWVDLTDEDWEKVANRKNTVLDTFEQGATWAAYKLERRNT